MVSFKKCCARAVSALLIMTLCMNSYVMPVLAEEKTEALKVETVSNGKQEPEEAPKKETKEKEEPEEETEEEHSEKETETQKEETTEKEEEKQEEKQEVKEEEEQQKEQQKEPEQAVPEAVNNEEPEVDEETEAAAGMPRMLKMSHGPSVQAASEPSTAKSVDKTDCSKQPEVTVTVSPDNPRDEKTEQPSAEDLLDEAALGALIADLAGWELLDEKGNTIGIVQADGTVKNGDQKIPLAFRSDGNGSYTLELITAKKGGEIVETDRKTTEETKDGVTTTTTTVKKEQEFEARQKKIMVTVVNGRTVIGYWKQNSASEEINNDIQMIQPDPDLLSKETNEADEELNGMHLCHDKPASDLTDGGSGEFRYVGYGVSGTALIARMKNQREGHIPAHQFKLAAGKDAYYYVYCADMSTSAKPGYYYNVNNVEDSSYYQGTNGAKHIQAICENGYWGTEKEGNAAQQDGVKQASEPPVKGSIRWIRALLTQYKEEIAKIAQKQQKTTEEQQILDALRALLTLTEDDISAIDDGIALAATQAAIWKFGNNDPKGEIYVLDTNSDWPIANYGATSGLAGEYDYQSLTDAEKRAGNALYRLLISDYLMNRTQNTATDLIKLEDITEASITVKDKVDTEKLDEAVKKALNGKNNDVYRTDLSFAMAVVPGTDDNLLVTIYCGGEKLGIWRLAGENAQGESYGMIQSDEQGSYTIPNIQLPEGMEITLELHGTQNLAPGVYLYSADGSQTFVGLSTSDSTRSLQLRVAVEFEVTDAGQRVSVEENSNKEKEEWEEVTVKTTVIPTIETKEREIPVYAKSVQTGDGAAAWYLPMLAAAAALLLAERKRKKAASI